MTMVVMSNKPTIIPLEFVRGQAMTMQVTVVGGLLNRTLTFMVKASRVTWLGSPTLDSDAKLDADLTITTIGDVNTPGVALCILEGDECDDPVVFPEGAEMAWSIKLQPDNVELYAGVWKVVTGVQGTPS